MPNYVVLFENGVYKIKRDRKQYVVPPISVAHKDSSFILYIEAKTKQRAIKEAQKQVQMMMQREQETKGSSVSQSTEIKTEQKSPIAIVPEAFEANIKEEEKND